MHLIYSRLTSSNVLSGVVGEKKKGFSVEFQPETTTKVNDEEYAALMDQEGSVFAFLHTAGDFIEKAVMVTSDIASLEGNLIKAQKALDDAKEALKDEDKNPIKLAEDVLMEAEDTLSKSKNADEKKKALKAVKEAKELLRKVQKAGK